MSPEIIVAVIGAAGVVGGATVPAVLGLRRARGAAEEEGAATRESVALHMAALAERIDGVRDELRSDVSELREQITDVRAWQAGHDAEHLLYRGHPDG